MNSPILFLTALCAFAVSAGAAGVGDYITAVAMLCTVGVCIVANDLTRG